MRKSWQWPPGTRWSGWPVVSDWRPGPAWLFCPANRPDRYRKALAAADVVILDLEDAVAPGSKVGARSDVVALARAGTLDRSRTVLRVNAAGTGEHAADLELASAVGFDRVMLAKAEDPGDVRPIKHGVVALIESPLGVERVSAVAESRNVVGLMWGADDLVAGLGGTSSRHPDGQYRDVATFVRQRVLLACKAHGRLALDAVHMNYPDLDGLSQACEDAAATGFDASVAIHPSQLGVIKAAYTPSPDRLDWARRLLGHVGDFRGVTTFEGRMVDGPIYLQAERMLQARPTTTARKTGEV